MSEGDSIEEGLITAAAFGKGLVHGALESPWNGAAQLANEALRPLTGAEIPEMHMTDVGQKPAAEMSDGEKYAQMGGTAIGAVVPLYLVNKAVGRLMGSSMPTAKTADLLGTAALRSELTFAAKQGLMTGAIYGAALTPTDKGENFWEARARNGVATSLSFGAFNVASAGGRVALARNAEFGSLTGKQFLARELPLTIGVGAGSGAVAGVVGAEANAFLGEGRVATSDELRENAISNAVFGGAFAGLHQVHSRSVKAAPLTEEQIAKIRWAERTDGKRGDWEPVYDRLFPPDEAQSKSALKEQFIGENPELPPDRPRLGQPQMTLHESYAPNGRMIAASINEVYPGRPTVPGEKGFILGAYTFVPEQLQSTGIGAHHLKNGVIPELKADFPAEKFQGRLTEIERTDGLTADSQPVRRARFYRDKIGMQAFDKTEFPYELPLFQPEGASAYVPQKQIAASTRSGPVPAEMLWTSFDGKPVTGAQGRGMYDRLARWGYGLEPSDPYLQERLNAIDATSPDLRRPIELKPVPSEATRWQSILAQARGAFQQAF